ncbi:hypothetical protein BLNAU_10433 [Blattamonas nauphoetae]|uniref:Uncharacterized protein n=1 Tax=Blattamonas nauphoetae TaxID=2049346 RepID=A0ABQ9XSX8_9EUKA|nr:hypothetical protein BLNAU_10433 [Blattamonas nauphoetae]
MSDLECPICLDEFREPLFCPQCWGGFCKDCVTGSYRRSQTCPICAAQIPLHEFKTLERAANIKQKLSVVLQKYNQLPPREPRTVPLVPPTREPQHNHEIEEDNDAFIAGGDLNEVIPPPLDLRTLTLETLDPNLCIVVDFEQNQPLTNDETALALINTYANYCRGSLNLSIDGFIWDFHRIIVSFRQRNDVVRLLQCGRTFWEGVPYRSRSRSPRRHYSPRRRYSRYSPPRRHDHRSSRYSPSSTRPPHKSSSHPEPTRPPANTSPIPTLDPLTVRTSHRLYVGNIPSSFTNSLLQDYLNTLFMEHSMCTRPIVSECVIGKEKSFAFVDLPSSRLVDEAVKLDGTESNGCCLKLGRPVSYLKLPAGFEEPEDGINQPEQPPPQEGYFNILTNAPFHPSSDNINLIYLMKFPPAFTEAQLRDLLSSIGPLASLQLLIDPVTHSSTGVALASFMNSALTDLAIKGLQTISFNGTNTLLAGRVFEKKEEQMVRDEE